MTPEHCPVISSFGVAKSSVKQVIPSEMFSTRLIGCDGAENPRRFKKRLKR